MVSIVFFFSFLTFISLRSLAICRDPSTHHLDGLNLCWMSTNTSGQLVDGFKNKEQKLSLKVILSVVAWKWVSHMCLKVIIRILTGLCKLCCVCVCVSVNVYVSSTKHVNLCKDMLLSLQLLSFALVLHSSTLNAVLLSHSRYSGHLLSLPVFHLPFFLLDWPISTCSSPTSCYRSRHAAVSCISCLQMQTRYQ